VSALRSLSLNRNFIRCFKRSGIGGGGFIIVRVPPSSPNTASEVYAIDFRETAPALANKTMYLDNPPSAMFGGLSVATPSELHGLAEVHRRWGALPWKKVVQPSADLAKCWKVDKELGRRIPVRLAPLCLDSNRLLELTPAVV
jgi:gamma-glutamyltranspeptidase / glutathione hydrolase / leukotriene-C4 hydrolase